MTSGSTKPHIISHAISLGTFNIITMVLGLISTVIIARHFSTEEFGIYTFVLVLVNFLSQISTFGLELSVSRFIAGTNDELNKVQIFGTAFIVRLCAIFLASLLAWYGSPLLRMLFGQSLLPNIIAYVPLLFAVESLRSLLKATLQGSLLFPRMGITDVIAGLLNLFLLIVVYLMRGDITLLILGRVFSSFVSCIFAFFSIPIRKKISFHIPAFKELMRFGFPLQLNDILGFIYNRIDTLAVAAFLGPADIAIYEVARKIPDYLRNLYDPFKAVYYPYISKRYALDGSSRASKFTNDAVRFVSFVTLFGVVIATLFGREILQLIFTDKYSSSAPVFVLLMINLSLALISNVMGTTLVAVGESKKPVIINFFNAIVSWAGSFLLSPLLGLMGAGIGNTLGTIVAFPLNRNFLRKKMELKDAPYLKPLFLSLLWGLLVYVVKPDSLLIKVVLLGVYVVASFMLSIVTKDDLIILAEGSGITSWPIVHRLGLWISRS